MNYSFLSEIKLARAPAASRIRIDEVNPVLSANSTENHFDSLFFLLRFRILTFRRLPHRSLLIAHYSLLIVVLASSQRWGWSSLSVGKCWRISPRLLRVLASSQNRCSQGYWSRLLKVLAAPHRGMSKQIAIAKA